MPENKAKAAMSEAERAAYDAKKKAAREQKQKEEFEANILGLNTTQHAQPPACREKLNSCTAGSRPEDTKPPCTHLDFVTPP